MGHHALTSLAIIMDGNGRWATRRGQSRTEGHKEGVKVVEQMITVAAKNRLSHLFLFAFAMKNRKRGLEAQYLMQLLSQFIAQYQQKFVDEGIKVRFIGNREDGWLSQSLLTEMQVLEAVTGAGRALTLVIAINYDGVDEVQRAGRRMCEQHGSDLTAFLDTAWPEQFSNPQVVIRTGMEGSVACFRDSSFLPLQTVDACKVSVPDLWPDIDANQLVGLAQHVFASEHHLNGALRPPEHQAAE